MAGHANDQLSTPADNLKNLTAVDPSQATRLSLEAGQYLAAQSANAPKTASELVAEAQSAEERYLHPAGIGSQDDLQRKEGLAQALGDISNYTRTHSASENQALISQLERKDLLGQLTITALEEGIQGAQKNGQRLDTLTEKQAEGLINEPGALGDAMRKHLSDAFSVTPDANHRGSGYADAVVRGNGAVDFGSPSAPGETPVITIPHVDELMNRFDHSKNFRGAGQNTPETWTDKLWDKIESIF